MGLMNNPRCRWRWYPLIQLAIFQLGWWVCVLGAAKNFPLAGPLYVAAAVALHLSMMRSLASECLLLASAAIIGFAADTVLAYTGLIGFHDSNVLSPLWMIGLWILFASVLRTSCSWLLGHGVLGAVLGAISGPIAYYGGVTLGALTFPHGLSAGLIAVTLEWAIALPILITIAGTIDRRHIVSGVPNHV